MTDKTWAVVSPFEEGSYLIHHALRGPLRFHCPAPPRFQVLGTDCLLA